MNKETRLILESLALVQKNQNELAKAIMGNEKEIQIKTIIGKINEALAPPTNNLAEQRAKEIGSDSEVKG